MSIRTLACLAATVSLLSIGSAAQATTTVWTFNGNSAADGPVDATASINLSASGLSVDLTSLLLNPTSDGQLLSGIQIFFDVMPATTALTTASGTEINISKGAKKGPNVTTGDDNVIHHWGTVISGGSLFLATVGTGAEGGKPEDLIIGDGLFTNANASIMQHNPEILGTGHFVLNFTGLTSTPFITGVNLEFGTSKTDFHKAICSGDCTPPITTSVPEPASWALMMLGFGGLGAVMRGRRAERAAVA